ncbi:hypothetical protein CYMTET_26839, partial [Cymbomonas tetramitiformis]
MEGCVQGCWVWRCSRGPGGVVGVCCAGWRDVCRAAGCGDAAVLEGYTRSGHGNGLFAPPLLKLVVGNMPTVQGEVYEGTRHGRGQYQRLFGENIGNARVVCADWRNGRIHKRHADISACSVATALAHQASTRSEQHSEQVRKEVMPSILQMMQRQQKGWMPLAESDSPELPLVTSAVTSGESGADEPQIGDRARSLGSATTPAPRHRLGQEVFSCVRAAADPAELLAYCLTLDLPFARAHHMAQIGQLGKGTRLPSVRVWSLGGAVMRGDAIGMVELGKGKG